jgi:hypothetical protein
MCSESEVRNNLFAVAAQVMLESQPLSECYVTMRKVKCCRVCHISLEFDVPMFRTPPE